MAVTKPNEFIGSGDIHGPKPYEFIGSGLRGTSKQQSFGIAANRVVGGTVQSMVLSVWSGFGRRPAWLLFGWLKF
jgi:hypothetical protein